MSSTNQLESPGSRASRSQRRVVAVATVIAAIVAIGAVAFARSTARSQPEATAGNPLDLTGGGGEMATTPAADGRPAWGPVDAPVTIIEFTDYECQFCQQFFRETLPKLQEKHSNSVRFVIRNFPMSSAHTFARGAAEAAGCAEQQGEFWAYHDRLFTSGKLAPDQLRDHAVALDLDMATFDRCVRTGGARQWVDEDIRAGRNAGIRGTPAFFINGQLLRGAQPFDTFDRIIRSVLRKHSCTPSSCPSPSASRSGFPSV